MRIETGYLQILAAFCWKAVPTSLGLILCLSTPAIPVLAQDWHVSARAGRIRSALDPSSVPSESFAFGLRYNDPGAALAVSAGIPTNSTEALWGGGGGWMRVAQRFGRFRAGVDLSGNAFLTMDRASQSNAPLPGPLDPPVAPFVDRGGYALAGQALPVLGYEGARWQVHTRAGMSRYAARFSGQRLDRTVRLADLQLTLTPVSSFALVPVVQRVEAAGEGPSTFAGVSAIAAATMGSTWASIGQWSGDSTVGTPWSAGGRLSLHPLVAVEVSARHDVFDPLYLQPAQTSWSMGLSLRLGGRSRAIAPPVPAAYLDGRATIRLPLSASRTQPSIAGDFNNWKPAAMQRNGDQWTYVVAIAPGVYNYSFVTAGGDWFVPESVPGRKSDGMGGHVAVLVVR